MNRLVIIGNGFDLAHGLPTSYGHFIDDFWLNLQNEIDKNSLIIKDIIVKSAFYELPLRYGDNQVKNYNDFKTNLSKLALDYRYVLNNKTLRCTTSDDRGKPAVIFEFRNHFFYHLCEMKNIQNWVDVENEYYNILKGKAIPEKIKCDYPNSVSKLNEEFDQVKKLFEKYLKEKVVEKFNFDHPGNDGFTGFLNKFYPGLLTDDFVGIKDAFSNEDKQYIDQMIKEKKQDDVILQFLCFNYTPTLKKYVNSLRENKINVHLNFIHGVIDNVDDNKINFGFGDEMDEDYKLIENLNDNEYLKNFKSFQYLQNSNYKKLLDFVDNDKYEVLIMGHSCGLSDRTLLNTIFENLNCSLIRVFYYEWKDEITQEIKDNYTELTQNISRHFDNKKVMRKKIADKTFCKRMPCNKLPKKEI